MFGRIFFKSVEDTFSGLIARLDLAGPPCNVFGADFQNVAEGVVHESGTWYVEMFAH